ncbi:vacuolar protein sorting 16B [Brevipalpus obovatus]|uniref:vacuolar protein sorting 16B n=1 Tax=Brevipalpus obovatus TaxID=246614 RepID=UPI003D9F8191
MTSDQSRQDSLQSDSFWEYSKPISFNFDDDWGTGILPEIGKSTFESSTEAPIGILSTESCRVVDSLSLISSEEAKVRVASYHKYFSESRSHLSSSFPRTSTLMKRLIAGEEVDICHLKSRKDKVALLDAVIDSCEGNAITTVLIFMEKTLCSKIFVNEIMTRPVATDHYIDYLRQTNRHRELTDFLIMSGRNEDAAVFNYCNAIKAEHMETKIKNLKHCLNNFFKDLQDDINLPSIIEQINLYERQLPIEAADSKDAAIIENPIPLPFSFIGSSVISTLFYCVLYHYQLSENNFASPKAIRKAHNISERQYYWTALKALAKAKRWTDIDQLFQYQTFFGSKKVKQIIPFDQVIKILAKEGAPLEVLTSYLRLISNEDTRMKLSQDLKIK